MRRDCVRILVLLVSLSAAGALAQASDAPADSELLLSEELPLVVTAARYAQPISEAPSAVSIVTAEEIQTHGYRTLGEILASVTGFYTTDDRNYSYAGVRGFGIAGDYNNRILVLVDGHRFNDAIYQSGQIDRSFPIDVGMMERVEVVRGPGSALYGTSAFFAVVNVITKRGRDLQGGSASASFGSDLTTGGTFALGRRVESGFEYAASVSGMRSDGKRTLYYPEFDDPATNLGIARNADREDEIDLFGSARLGDVSMQIAWGQRDKRIPTAAFGTYFGTTRTQTRDSTGWIHAAYESALRGDWILSARGYVDRYYYRGNYVYDYSTTPTPFLVDNDDLAEGERTGADLQLSGSVGARNRVTFGGEAIYNFELSMRNRDLLPALTYIDANADSFDWALFLQDEVELTAGLSLLVGVRHDHNDFFGGSTNPRLAVIWEPVAGTTLKALYGRAFRAPSFYELFYIGPNYAPPQALGPERIGTAELVWEQRLGSGLRFVASGFFSSIDDLIALMPLTSGELQFQNRDDVKAFGGEFTVEGRWGVGWTGRIGLVAERTQAEAGRRLANSPRVLGTFAFATPLFWERVQLAFDARYVGQRETGKSADAPAAFIPNLTLHLRDIAGPVDLTITAKNLFDRTYYDPAGEEHVQSRIEQNGLTFLATATTPF